MFSDQTPILYNAPWHDLKHVCVGNTYGPDFYEPVKNVRIRESLQRIARETIEDYKNLISVLEKLETRVDQIQIDPSTTIMDYVNVHGKIDYTQSQSFTLIPRPPMQPRDSVLIVGDRVLLTNEESRWFTDLFCANRTVRSSLEFDAPLVTPVGDRLVADCRDHPNLADVLREVFPDREVIPVTIGGHNDAVFSILAPGVIASTHHHTDYAETFPGWRIKFIENQSWNAVPEWRKFKHSNRDRWWSPESQSNPEFADFVDTWLENWLGYVGETVFDINMLQINQKCVLVNNYNSDLFAFLEENKIDPIIVPFRHRFFWDGGLHCITNDLYREGPYECYF